MSIDLVVSDSVCSTSSYEPLVSGFIYTVYQFLTIRLLICFYYERPLTGHTLFIFAMTDLLIIDSFLDLIYADHTYMLSVNGEIIQGLLIT